MAIMVKMGTKKAEELIRDMNYRHPKGESLYDVYGSVSKKKRESWEDIRKDCEYLDGEMLHIVGAGSHFYSCIYAYPIFDYRTGDAISMLIRKETKGSRYELELPIDVYLERIYRR